MFEYAEDIILLSATGLMRTMFLLLTNPNPVANAFFVLVYWYLLHLFIRTKFYWIFFILSQNRFALLMNTCTDLIRHIIRIGLLIFEGFSVIYHFSARFVLSLGWRNIIRTLSRLSKNQEDKFWFPSTLVCAWRLFNSANHKKCCLDLLWMIFS